MSNGYGLTLTNQALLIIGLVSIFYFACITTFGTYFSRFSQDINDFFFSGQRFSWWLGAASMTATGIGSYSYLKYSEQGLNTGMSSSLVYLNDWFIVPFLLFGWLPIIYYSRIHSVPEYFQRRFGRSARYIAVTIILAYMFFYIAYNLFTIGVAVEGLFGWSQLYSVPLIALLLGAYVTLGGQTAVIFTDLLQGIMLYLAGGIAIVAGLKALGGIGEFWSYLPPSHRLPFVHLNENPRFNTSGLFWGEALAGSIAFNFMNQGFLMRYLAIKSVHDGRKAALFNVAGNEPLSAIVVGAVGWIAKALLIKQATIGGAIPGYDLISIENSFHTFVIVAWETLQQNSWMFGFVIAALTAALMSTVDTLINACAAVGIYDIYRPLVRPEADDRHYLRAARIASALATVIGCLLVIWFNQQKGSLMSIHYKGIMVIIPALVTTIFLGAFWPRFNTAAANISMVSGSALTIVSVYQPQLIDPLARLVQGPTDRAYIYMRAMFGMVVTAIIGIFVTLITPRSQREIGGLTASTIDEGMTRFKGGPPNHAVGRKVRCADLVIDDHVPMMTVRVTEEMMNRLAAQEGDLIYVSDYRWWLGGLRSEHFRLGAPEASQENTALISQASREKAFLLPHRPVTLEKIL